MANGKRDGSGVSSRTSLTSSVDEKRKADAAGDEQGFLQKTGGKIVTSLVCLLLVGLMIYEVRAYLQGGTPSDVNTSMYVDSTTGQAFAHKNVIGEAIPILAPSGGATGYPGVPCYWTAAGELKKDPTWVLLNQAIGKSGPTFCPDCGRLVVPHAPLPQPGDRPPPLREELLHSNPAALQAAPAGRL